MKRIARLLVALLMVVPMISFAGCGGGGGGGKGDRLILSFTDEMETMLEMYYEAHPTPEEDKFKLQIIAYEEYTNQLSSRFRSGNNLPALVTLEEKPSRAFIENNYFIGLDDLITDDNDMYDYTFNAGKHNDTQYGLSWQATPGGFFFRTDVAKRFIPGYLGITSNSSVDEIVTAVQAKMSTWEDFVELGKQLNTASNGGVKILSSNNDPSRVFVSNREKAWVENENGTDYLRIDASVKEYFETIEALEIGVNESGEAVSTLDRLTNGTDDSSMAWTADMNTTLAQYDQSRENGDASDDVFLVFGYFLPTWGLHYNLKKYATNTAGNWAVTSGPQAFSDGGTWLAVTNGHKYADEAKEIVKYVTTNKAFLKAWAEETSDFVNSKSVMAEVSASFAGDTFLGNQNHYNIFKAAAEVNKPGPLSKYDVYISNTAVRSWAANYGVRTNHKNTGINYSDNIDDYFVAFAKDVQGQYHVINIDNWKTW